MIRVLLADDHAAVRFGLRRILEQYDDIEVVSESESGEQANESFNDVLPDVLIMDVSMPGIGGLEALRRILTHHESARVIIYSMHESATIAAQAISHGAAAYVEKTADSKELVQAIRTAMMGKTYLSRLMAHKIAIESVSGGDNPFRQLTAREFEVFRLLAEGRAVSEIADILIIGHKTVANHQTLIKQKLDIDNPIELVRLAIKYEIIEATIN